MLDFGLVATGMAIGVAVAAPIGPVNLIVIRRTLRHGRLNGLVTGAGAAMGDGVFAGLAAFSLTAAIDFLLSYELWLQAIGGLFLIILGLRTLLSHPHLADADADKAAGVPAHVFLTTFALTITNPATMLGFIAIFSGVAGLRSAGQGYGHAATLTGAVIIGSMLWWFGLSQFVSLFRQRMSDHMLEVINRISGGLIIMFGIAVWARVLLKWLG